MTVPIAGLAFGGAATAQWSADPGSMQTAQCIEPFDATLQIALDLLDLGLDADGNLEAIPSCSGSPTVCCPGGTPSATCGPLHLDLVEAAIDAPPGADRLDLTYRVHVATVADIPIEIPTVGECLVHVDSTPGASSAVQADLPISLSADQLHIVAVGDVTMSNVESSDFQLTGAFGCSLANPGLGFFVGLLSEALQSAFQGDPDLCRLCDSTIATCAPEPGAGPLGSAALLALAARAHRRRRAAPSPTPVRH